MTTSYWDEASSGFAHWQRELWQPLADHLVKQAQAQPGERVLDACCGTGSSARPVALAVGSSGWVDAVDISATMIELASSANKDLPQLKFIVGDLDDWPSQQPYDLVLCGFGLFFLGEPGSALQSLRSRLAPGGRLVLSSWQNRPFEPLSSLVLAAIAEEGQRTTASTAARNIGKTNTAEKPKTLFGTIGLSNVRIEAVSYRVPLTPESAWRFVQGSLLKGALPDDPASLQRIQHRVNNSLPDQMRADALFASASIS